MFPLVLTSAGRFSVNRILLIFTTFMLLPLALCSGLEDERISKADRDFFEQRIRPVLVQHCYACHSESATELGGKLKLDSSAGWQRGGESGPALIAGKPNQSLIITAMQHADLEMPPDRPLPESVVNDFIKWIERGAPDPRGQGNESPEAENADSAPLKRDIHWSFFPRRDPEPPDVSDPDWPRDPLDRFVQRQWSAAQLQPTDDAPPQTLVRRLYYDLIGLPPTFEQVHAFVDAYKQNRDDAVAELVDSLLAKPQFGERWGRHWLDVARYGESNGDDGLGRNASFPHAWRYRDYVIEAFNSDKPYDRFITEQIAGDLLPAKSAHQRNQQLVATAFLAIGSKPAAAMNNNFAMDVVDDQINTVSTAVLGLSVACARCHDHKHDPIPTRDYYAIAGVFNSTETLYGRSADEKLTAPPTALHALQDPSVTNQPQPVLIKSTPQFPADYPDSIAKLEPQFYSSLQTAADAWSVAAGVEFPSDGYAQVKESTLQSALAETGPSYSVAFWFKNSIGNQQRPITAYLFSRAEPGTQQTGDHLGIGGTHEKDRAGRLFVFNGSNQAKMLGGPTVIPPGTWNHVVLVREDQQIRVFLNGHSEPEFEGELPATFGESKSYFLATRADKFAPLTGNVGEFAIFDRALNGIEAARLHSASGQPKGVKATPPFGLAMGVREKTKVSDCKIHIDGETAKLGPSIPRGVLTAYQRVVSEQPVSVQQNFANNPVPPAANQNFPDRISIATNASGRLELAQWLTHPNHPQTARVIVNRVWLHLFGQAIVATPDDFGVYGARPTHPELLDHLAHRLVNENWSLKGLIRSIVLSRTYQLDSRCDALLATSDPDNRLYLRHLRRRLDAESLRDSILQASGQLELQPGSGSAVEQIDQLINWPPGEATDLHRPSNHRSIYLCMLRHAPPPELSAFDLPDGVSVTGIRNQTILPTQALFLLNSPLVVEQSQKLAERIWQDKTWNTQRRIEEAYRRCLQRTPTKLESARAIDYLRSSATVSPNHEEQLAAWAGLCHALLASNEFRYVD